MELLTPAHCGERNQKLYLWRAEGGSCLVEPFAAQGDISVSRNGHAVGLMQTRATRTQEGYHSCITRNLFGSKNIIIVPCGEKRLTAIMACNSQFAAF
jgi:hypothetical protein